MKKVVITVIYSFLFFFVASSQNSPNFSTAKNPPSWVSEGVIYQVFLRSFTKEGTLKAAEKRLPNIADLGATIVYLSPVMLSDSSMNRDYWSPRQKASIANNPRNPYRIMDYYKIDPEYGIENDLKDFMQSAHNLGLKVIMDVVFYHTGPNNALTENPEYYVRDENRTIIKNEYNFYTLNFENKDLREYLTQNMEYWLKEFNVDGFRCDVSYKIPVDFWEQARPRLESIKPDVFMLAEGRSPLEPVKAFDVTYDNHRWEKAIKAVVTNGDSAVNIQKTWETQVGLFPMQTTFLRLTENHDKDRTIIKYGEKGSKAATVINFTIDGLPFIYNGQEIGDGAPMSIYTNWPILWEASTLPDKQNLYNWYKELIAIRKNNPALRNGETVWLKTSNPESILAFLRKSNNKDQEVLTIVNVSNRKIDNIKIEIPDRKNKTYRNIFSTNKEFELLKSEKGKISTSLGSFGYTVTKRDSN